VSEEKVSSLAKVLMWPMLVLAAFGPFVITVLVLNAVRPQVLTWTWEWIAFVPVSTCCALAWLVLLMVCFYALAFPGRTARWTKERRLATLLWLEGLVKRPYVWLLWHLVIRPARDHRGLMVAAEGQHNLLKYMSQDSLLVLAFVAESYLTGKHTTNTGTVMIEPPYWTGQTGSLPRYRMKGRQKPACDELLAEGFLVKAEWSTESEDDWYVEVRLPLWCTLGGGARAVLRGVTLELGRRARAEEEAGSPYPRPE